MARISFDTTEKKLRREFEQYGPVRAVKMINDREDKSRWVTDRQTYLALRLIDRQTGIQIADRHRDRQTDRHIDRLHKTIFSITALHTIISSA